MRRGEVLEVLELGELTVAGVLDAPEHASPGVGHDHEEQIEEETVVGAP